MTDTKQLAQWRGAFGDAYIERNVADAKRLRASTAMWARILQSIAGDPPQSIIEVGANIGANLLALRQLTDAMLWAVEPNACARAIMAERSVVERDHLVDGVAQHIPLADRIADLAFTCGVLIHIAPGDLLAACKEVHRCAKKYVACIEYFADQPEEKAYRGESGLLFKCDFGAFWLDNFPDLAVVDCGFNWARTTGLDNSTWWVFRKR